MTKTHSLTSMLVVVYAVVGLAGCDSATAPSSMPQVVEGTLDLQPVTFDVITIQVNRDGLCCVLCAKALEQKERSWHKVACRSRPTHKGVTP